MSDTSTTAHEEKLLATIGKLQIELEESRSWNGTISQMLLHRETQVQAIIEALGEDAAPEHPGKAAFRNYISTIVEDGNDG